MKETIECKICGKTMKALNVHVPRIHKISCTEYKEQFPGAEIYSEATREKYAKTLRAVDKTTNSYRQAMSKAKKGVPLPSLQGRKRTFTPEHCKAISDAKTGKPHASHSEETKRKISESNMGKTVVVSEETKKKISIANTGKKRTDATRKRLSEAKTQWHKDNPKRSKTVSDQLQQWYEEHPEDRAKNMALARSKSKYFNTKIEQKVEQLLKDLKVKYTAQRTIKELPEIYRFHHWDFLLPTKMIAIEADGCYWHGCSICHPERQDELKEEIDTAVLRDQAASKQGWTILRFWEHEVNEDFEHVAQVIEESLSERKVNHG